MSLIRKSLKDTSVYGLGLFLMKLSTVIVLPILTRKLSPEEYGVLGFIIILQPIFRYLIPCDISQAVSFFLVDHVEESDRKKIISTGLWFSLVLLLFSGLVSLLMAYFYYVPNKIINFRVMSIGLLALFVDSILYYFLNILRWLGMSICYSFVSVMNAWLSIVLVIIAIYIFNSSVLGVLFAWLLAWTVSMIISVVRLKKFIVFQFDAHLFKRMFLFSLPLWLNNIPSKLNSVLSRYLIVFLLGASQLGIFTACYTLSSVSGFLPSLIELSLLPIIYRCLAKENNTKEVDRLFCATINITMVTLLLYIICNKYIINIMLGSAYRSSSEVFLIVPVLVLVNVIPGIKTFFQGMMVAKKTSYCIFPTIASLLTGLIFGLVLTINYGVLGASISMLVAFIVELLVYIYFSQKFHYIQFFFHRSYITMTFLVVIVAGSLWSGFFSSLQREVLLGMVILMFGLLELYLGLGPLKKNSEFSNS